MTNETIRRLGGEKRQDRQAMLALDIYRRVAEGQARPCAWTLIRLQSGATGPAPMVGELVQRLRASDGAIFSGFADCLTVLLKMMPPTRTIAGIPLGSDS